MNNDLNTEFFRKVLDEVTYAEAKHRSFPDDKVHASAILNEEAGKLTQASIDWECDNLPDEEAMRRMKNTRHVWQRWPSAFMKAASNRDDAYPF